jgi:hypothetical protein
MHRMLQPASCVLYVSCTAASWLRIHAFPRQLFLVPFKSVREAKVSRYKTVEESVALLSDLESFWMRQKNYSGQFENSITKNYRPTSVPYSSVQPSQNAKYFQPHVLGPHICLCSSHTLTTITATVFYHLFIFTTCFDTSVPSSGEIYFSIRLRYHKPCSMQRTAHRHYFIWQLA